MIYKCNNKIFLLLVLLLGSVDLSSHNAQSFYLIDGKYEDNSVIKMWYTVLGLMEEYDRGKIAGFKIDFDQEGKHFNAGYGNNWWEYYFSFNEVGVWPKEASLITRLPRYKRSIIRFETVCTMRPERANYLLNKYMSLQPNLQLKLAQMKNKYLAHSVPIVAVYYQNPIMSEVQPAWTPQEICNRVKQEIKKFVSCKICLFTELPEYIDLFRSEFEEQLISIPELANTKETRADIRGEHELLTLLLLAQSDMVVASGSYQGVGAKMLNPNLTLIELDQIPYACE